MTDRAKKNRTEKKSETIEVRVSYSEKLAFMEACKQAGTTASHAIRDYIGEFLNPGSERPLHRSPFAVVGVISALLILLFVVFIGQRTPVPPSTTQRVFNHFDRDGDGFLTQADSEGASLQTGDTVLWLMKTADKNADSRVDISELGALTEIMVEVQASNEGARKSGQERILVVPPDLTPAEQRAFLEQSGAGEHLSAEERTRLLRILNAIAEVNRADDLEGAGDKAAPN